MKVLLDRVKVEDRGCTEKVYRGLLSTFAKPGHLSHLERPNFDFAQYLAERTGGFVRGLGITELVSGARCPPSLSPRGRRIG